MKSIIDLLPYSSPSMKERICVARAVLCTSTPNPNPDIPENDGGDL